VSAAFTSAPFDTKNFTDSKSPLSAARCKRVIPRIVFELTSILKKISSLIIVFKKK